MLPWFARNYKVGISSRNTDIVNIVYNKVYFTFNLCTEILWIFQTTFSLNWLISSSSLPQDRKTIQNFHVLFWHNNSRGGITNFLLKLADILSFSWWAERISFCWSFSGNGPFYSERAPNQSFAWAQRLKTKIPDKASIYIDTNKYYSLNQPAICLLPQHTELRLLCSKKAN